MSATLAGVETAAEQRAAAELLSRRDLITLATGVPAHRLTLAVPPWMFAGLPDLGGSPLWHADVAAPMVAVPCT